MTKAEWLQCADPDELLQLLESRASSWRARWLPWPGVQPDRTILRKVRLFVSACYRFDWPSLDATDRKRYELFERYADGLASSRQLHEHARAVGRSMGPGYESLFLHDARVYERQPFLAARRAALWAGHSPSPAEHGGFVPCLALAPHRLRWLCDLLRDIVGNPFQRVIIDPSCLSWNEGCLGKMARDIYDARRYEELPVLADALEEAGCTNQDILAHCRQGSEHARGCWVLDLLRGRS
jgi:hypothetical protein